MKRAGSLALIFALASACSREEEGPAVPEATAIYGSKELEQGPQAEPEKTADADVDPSPDLPPVMEEPTDGRIEVPDLCAGQASKTSAKTMASGFQISGAAQTLKYELELLDCNGKSLALNAQNIAFDLDLGAAYQGFAYEIIDSKSAAVLASGEFAEKDGFDVYGPRDSWVIMETGPLRISDAVRKIILNVKVKSFPGSRSKRMSVKTFQKIGDSEPAIVPLNVLN